MGVVEPAIVARLQCPRGFRFLQRTRIIKQKPLKRFISWFICNHLQSIADFRSDNRHSSSRHSNSRSVWATDDGVMKSSDISATLAWARWSGVLESAAECREALQYALATRSSGSAVAFQNCSTVKMVVRKSVKDYRSIILILIYCAITFDDPAGMRKGFWALIKFDVSVSSEVVLLLLSSVADALALSFVVGTTFAGFFVRFAGTWDSAGLVVVFCFCICLHFALLFLNQTFPRENTNQESKWASWRLWNHIKW